MTDYKINSRKARLFSCNKQFALKQKQNFHAVCMMCNNLKPENNKKPKLFSSDNHTKKTMANI